MKIQFSNLGVCKLKMKTLTGMIQTPNYPEKYLRKADCLWTIDFGMGMDVVVNFLVFDVEKIPECAFDYATLYKGTNVTIGRYCGFELPPRQRVTGPLSIGFNSDGDTESKGFVVEYEAIGKSVLWLRFCKKQQLILPAYTG